MHPSDHMSILHVFSLSCMHSVYLAGTQASPMPRLAMHFSRIAISSPRVLPHVSFPHILPHASIPMRELRRDVFRSGETITQQFTPIVSCPHKVSDSLRPDPISSVLVVSGGSVGRFTPTLKITALRAAEGRSVGSFRPDFFFAALRAAGRSVGADRPGIAQNDDPWVGRRVRKL